MKILFLDNDGVICLSNNWGGRDKKRIKFLKDNPEFSEKTGKIPVHFIFDDFDKKAVKVLNEIIEETGCEIVVSSDWRLHANLEEIGEYYTSQGIIKKPIDITGMMESFDPEGYGLYTWKGWLSRIRCTEIREWLRINQGVEKWCAVDDLNMGLEGLENFVLTPSSREGIKKTGTKEKIIEFLK